LQREKFLERKASGQGNKKHRKFFDRFADSKQFDPLDAEKWYSISKQDIKQAGGNSILTRYEGSHFKALKKLYPELVWRKETSFTYGDWKNPKKQRQFFDEFAASKRFQPSDVGSWYSVSNMDIRKAGGSGILKYYKGSHIRAIMLLYPELSLQTKKFLLEKTTNRITRNGFLLMDV